MFLSQPLFFAFVLPVLSILSQGRGTEENLGGDSELGNAVSKTQQPHSVPSDRLEGFEMTDLMGCTSLNSMDTLWTFLGVLHRWSEGYLCIIARRGKGLVSNEIVFIVWDLGMMLVVQECAGFDWSRVDFFPSDCYRAVSDLC